MKGEGWGCDPQRTLRARRGGEEEIRRRGEGVYLFSYLILLGFRGVLGFLTVYGGCERIRVPTLWACDQARSPLPLEVPGVTAGDFDFKEH